MALITLPSGNKVLQETIQHKLDAAKKEACDAKLYDFDEIFYRLFIDPADKTKMLVSLQAPNWSEVRGEGSEDLVKEKLGDFVKDVTDSGVDFEINLEGGVDAAATAETFSNLRIFALGGPLFKYAKALAGGSALKKPFDFKFRPDTHCWIVPKADRLAVVFSFELANEADRIICNQVLTEFVEVRRQRDVSNTPVVAFSPKDPPAELKGLKIPSVNSETFVGYFTILLLPSHIKGAKLDKAIENVVSFRAYLTYHIKCAKAFFHQSMRATVKSMLGTLNRARFEGDAEARKKKKIIVSAK